jgi:subtilisin family serine protease
MELKIIVLKETVASKIRPRNKDFRLVATTSSAGGETPSELAIEVRDTTERDRRELRKEPGVVCAAPQMPVGLIKSVSASSTGGSDGGGNAPKDSWGIAAVNALDSKYTGKGVTVAILDTGIEPSHAAFKDVKLVRMNFTGESDDDIDGHGTHCAGTIFGRDVDGSRIGIARGVTTALIGKIIGKDGGSTEHIAKAIAWAQGNGAQIISMSIGLDFVGYQKRLQTEFGLPEQQATSMALAGYLDNVRLFDRISAVTSSGAAIVNSAVVAAAAGNESKRPTYSIVTAPPAKAEFFLPVAALGPGAGGKPPYQLAEFSNSGAVFAAPGVDILSAKTGGGLTRMSGTSQATPHVAGVAALWVERLAGSFGATRAIDLMKANCVKLTPDIAEDDVSCGLIQAPAQ